MKLLDRVKTGLSKVSDWYGQYRSAVSPTSQAVIDKSVRPSKHFALDPTFSSDVSFSTTSYPWFPVKTFESLSESQQVSFLALVDVHAALYRGKIDLLDAQITDLDDQTLPAQGLQALEVQKFSLTEEKKVWELWLDHLNDYEPLSKLKFASSFAVPKHSPPTDSEILRFKPADSVEAVARMIFPDSVKTLDSQKLERQASLDASFGEFFRNQAMQTSDKGFVFDSATTLQQPSLFEMFDQNKFGATKSSSAVREEAYREWVGLLSSQKRERPEKAEFVLSTEQQYPQLSLFERENAADVNKSLDESHSIWKKAQNYLVSRSEVARKRFGKALRKQLDNSYDLWSSLQTYFDPSKDFTSRMNKSIRKSAPAESFFEQHRRNSSLTKLLAGGEQFTARKKISTSLTEYASQLKREDIEFTERSNFVFSHLSKAARATVDSIEKSTKAYRMSSLDQAIDSATDVVKPTYSFFDALFTDKQSESPVNTRTIYETTNSLLESIYGKNETLDTEGLAGTLITAQPTEEQFLAVENAALAEAYSTMSEEEPEGNVFDVLDDLWSEEDESECASTSFPQDALTIPETAYNSLDSILADDVLAASKDEIMPLLSSEDIPPVAEIPENLSVDDLAREIFSLAGEQKTYLSKISALRAEKGTELTFEDYVSLSSHFDEYLTSLSRVSKLIKSSGTVEFSRKLYDEGWLSRHDSFFWVDAASAVAETISRGIDTFVEGSRIEGPLLNYSEHSLQKEQFSELNALVSDSLENAVNLLPAPTRVNSYMRGVGHLSSEIERQYSFINFMCSNSPEPSNNLPDQELDTMLSSAYERLGTLVKETAVLMKKKETVIYDVLRKKVTSQPDPRGQGLLELQQQRKDSISTAHYSIRKQLRDLRGSKLSYRDKADALYLHYREELKSQYDFFDKPSTINERLSPTKPLGSYVRKAV